MLTCGLGHTPETPAGWARSPACSEAFRERSIPTDCGALRSLSIAPLQHFPDLALVSITGQAKTGQAKMLSYGLEVQKNGRHVASNPVELAHPTAFVPRTHASTSSLGKTSSPPHAPPYSLVAPSRVDCTNRPPSPRPPWARRSPVTTRSAPLPVLCSCGPYLVRTLRRMQGQFTGITVHESYGPHPHTILPHGFSHRMHRVERTTARGAPGRLASPSF